MIITDQTLLTVGTLKEVIETQVAPLVKEALQAKDAEIATLRDSLAAAEREVERLKVELNNAEMGITPCIMCEKLQHQAEARALAAERARDNLLARIHRDGGHYTQEHGVEKACADADLIVANLFGERDEAVEVLRWIVVKWDDGLPRESFAPNVARARAVLEGGAK